jgi:hypothetical protein
MKKLDYNISCHPVNKKVQAMILIFSHGLFASLVTSSCAKFSNVLHDGRGGCKSKARKQEQGAKARCIGLCYRGDKLAGCYRLRLRVIRERGQCWLDKGCCVHGLFAGWFAEIAEIEMVFCIKCLARVCIGLLGKVRLKVGKVGFSIA